MINRNFDLFSLDGNLLRYKRTVNKLFKNNNILYSN